MRSAILTLTSSASSDDSVSLDDELASPFDRARCRFSRACCARQYMAYRMRSWPRPFEHCRVRSVCALHALRSASIFSLGDASEQNVLTKATDLHERGSESASARAAGEGARGRDALGRDRANGLGTAV